MAPPRRRALRPAGLKAIGAVAAAIAATAAVRAAVCFAPTPGAGAPVRRSTAAARGTAGTALAVGAVAPKAAGSALLRRAEGDDAPAAPAPVPLWLDFRAKRIIDPAAFAFGGAPEDLPEIRGVVVDLVQELKAKLQAIGMPAPKGKLIDGILVDEPKAAEIIEQVKPLGFRVFTVATDIEGVRLPDNAIFVCDSETKLPIGALEAQQIQLTTLERKNAINVLSIVPEEGAEEAVAAQAAADEEAMRKYDEGLKNEDLYVPPPKQRMREIWLGTEEKKGEILPVTMGEVLATTLPPEPLLWARALMQRRKESGKSMPSYSLKSDREAEKTKRSDNMGKALGL